MMQNSEIDMYENYSEQRVNRRVRTSSSRVSKPKAKIKNSKKTNFKFNMKNLNFDLKKINIKYLIGILIFIIIIFGIKMIFFSNNSEKVKGLVTSYLSEYKKNDDKAILNFSKTELERRIDKEENRLMEFKVNNVELIDKSQETYSAQIEVQNVDKSEVIRKTKQSLNDEKINLDNPKYDDEYIKRYIKYQNELKNSKQKRNYNLIIKKNKGKNTFYIQNATEVK